MKKTTKTKKVQKMAHPKKVVASKPQMKDQTGLYAAIGLLVLVVVGAYAVSTYNWNAQPAQHSAAPTVASVQPAPQAEAAPAFSAYPVLKTTGPANGHVPASSTSVVLSFDVNAQNGNVDFKNAGDNSQAYLSMDDFQPSNSNQIAVELDSNVPMASGADCMLVDANGLVLGQTKTLKGNHQFLRFTFEKNGLSVAKDSSASLNVICNTEAMLSGVSSYAQPTVTAKLPSNQKSVEWSDASHQNVPGYGDKAVPHDMDGFTVMGKVQM